MKPMSALFMLMVLVFCGVLPAADVPAKAAAPEAKVSAERKADGVHYTITITPPFKMNRKAPFKFELRKNAEEILKQVSLDEFAKEKDREVYRFVSTTGEKRVHYWFIACKYQGEEIVACKTFTAKEDIP